MRTSSLHISSLVIAFVILSGCAQKQAPTGAATEVSAKVPAPSVAKLERMHYDADALDTKETEAADQARALGIDYQSLVTTATTQPKALRTYFLFGRKTDGAGGETHAQFVWPVLHAWKDAELAAFFAELPPAERTEFGRFIRDSAFLLPPSIGGDDFDRYMTTFFPATWQALANG